MLIMKGCLMVSRGELYGIYLPDFAYQVRRDGQPIGEYDYRGPGTVNKSTVIVGDPYRATNLFEYGVDDEPTPESVEFAAGFESALRQLRATPPQNVSQNFYDGWHSGYIETLKETPAQRAERKRLIRRDRQWANARAERDGVIL